MAVLRMFFCRTSARPRRRDLLGRDRLAEGAPHERAYGAKRWVLWGGGAAFLWRGGSLSRRRLPPFKRDPGRLCNTICEWYMPDNVRKE